MNHKNRDPNQQLQDHDSAIQTLKTIINNVHKNFFFSNCLLSFLINKNHTVFYNIIQYYSFTIQHTKLSSGIDSLCIKTSFWVFWNSIHVCFSAKIFSQMVAKLSSIQRRSSNLLEFLGYLFSFPGEVLYVLQFFYIYIPEAKGAKFVSYFLLSPMLLLEKYGLPNTKPIL